MAFKDRSIAVAGNLVDRIDEMNFLANACGEISDTVNLLKQPYWWIQKKRAEYNLKVAVKALMEMLRSPRKDEFKEHFPTLLNAGQTLYEVGQFSYATEYFNFALRTCDINDHDVRLCALMGKFEVALTIKARDALIRGKADPDGYFEMKHSWNIISNDLRCCDVSPEVKESLEMQLANAKTRMDVLSIGRQIKGRVFADAT